MIRAAAVRTQTTPATAPRASAHERERTHAAPPGPSPRSRRVGFPRAHTRPPWSRTRPQNGSRRNPNSDGSGRPRDGGGGERGVKEGARLEAGAAPLDGGVSAGAMMRRFSGCAGGRWIREHPGGLASGLWSAEACMEQPSRER